MPPQGMPEEDSFVATVIKIIVQNVLYCGCEVYVQSIHRSSLMSGTSIKGVLPVEVTPEKVFFNLQYPIQVFEVGGYTFPKDIL